MIEPRNAFVQGAICGGFVAAGVLLILFWYVLFTSANAGAMVAGRFRPYQDDPSGYAIALGGVVLLVASLAALAWSWRRLPGPSR